jgi:D-glycero-alpha-D-manno-heptose-7-phosphate kinase
MPTKKELVLDAIHVEQNLIGEYVGSQDQTAAAFGGLNKISFNSMNDIEVDPIILPSERRYALQENLMLFFTGFSRNASDLAKVQIEATCNNENKLNTIVEICNEGLSVLIDTKQPIDNFGKLLGEQWKVKRELTDKISNNEIDSIYEAGLSAGALGGKLLGAGGGGFILFYVKKNKQYKVRSALKRLLYIPFSFEFTGSKIIYYSRSDN